VIQQAGPKSTILSLYNILSVVCDKAAPSNLVVAEIVEEADLVRLPLEAFKGLREKYPASISQLIQVTLTRFQRVSFLTLNKYFGLTTELLNAEETPPASPPTSPRSPRSPMSMSPAVSTPMTYRNFGDMEESAVTQVVVDRICELLGVEASTGLAGFITFETYEEGELLIEKDELGAGIAVVVEGSLEVSMFDLKQRRNVLEVVEPGGLAGHWAFVTGCQSALEVKAKTACRVATLSRRSFDIVMERNPKLWVNVGRTMLTQLSPLVRQIDFALEWVHITAGQILYSQGDESDDIYFVLHGRLRSHIKMPSGEVIAHSEYTPGHPVGDVDSITQTPRLATVHTVRDTELAKIPRQLFYFLALRYPQAMIQISKGIATKSQADMRPSKLGMPLQHDVKTVAILPLSTADTLPLDLFAQSLLLELNRIGPSILIDNTSVLQQLGKNAFNPVGELKLSSWLEEQEERHRIVLYKADQVGTPWMQKCVRQADCILLVALSYQDTREGDVEVYLKASKNTVRKELVLLHEHKYLAPGSTYRWLKDRPWIQLHHHALIPASTGVKRQNTGQAVRHPQSEAQSANRDVARLARYLTKESVAIALGGGGARGLAHVGFLRAIEEAGIPVDMIGGTSFGAFVGGLYARNADTVSIMAGVRKFCFSMSSTWTMAWDLTYPVAAWFSGSGFNSVVRKIFSDQQIEDLWLNYFCVTTNITKSRLEIHRTGTLWRYVRASMSLSGFLPPLCDQGDMLVDGGYLNNVPADVMRSLVGARRVIAVDVAIGDDTDPMSYGDSLSGWYVVRGISVTILIRSFPSMFLFFFKILNSINPFGTKLKAPTIAEIQSRLAYVSCNNRLEEVKQMEGCLYVQPPIFPFKLMDFHKHKEIIEVGYKFGKETVETWRQNGTFKEFLLDDAHLARYKRRNSH